MASSFWLREITTAATGGATGLPFALKALALYLWKILGYTDKVEVVAGGRSFFSYAASGTHGEFNLTGTDEDFKDTTYNAFAGGDITKWILVVDDARNAGLYQITACAGPTTVTLDFRSGAAEWPTQTTGLTWYMLETAAGVPIASGDYCRLRTPHSYGWELEITYLLDGANPCGSLRVSLNHDWTATGKILGPVYFGAVSTKTCWFYAQGQDDGQWLNVMMHNSTDNINTGAIVSTLIPCSLGLGLDNMVVLMGSASSTVSNFNDRAWTRSNTNTNAIGHGYSWATNIGQKQVNMVEASYGNSAASFVNFAWQANSRDSIIDVLNGTLVVLDPDGTDNLFGVLGNLQGHYSVTSNVADRTAFDHVATQDLFHFKQGVAFDWPGPLTPQH